MNREERNNEERYSHFAFLHVRPASLFIGAYFFTTSVLKLIKLSSGYILKYDDESRRYTTISTINRPTTTLLFMIHLMVAIVSAILIYGVTKSKASYLMPFFGIQLYHFLFSLPSSLSHLSYATSVQARNQFSTNAVTSPSDIRTLLRNADATYTISALTTFIDFLCDIFFICIIWKCYRYLKMKEIAASLSLPYNLDLEIVVPSDVISTISITPPDYETATKDSPPPDYESAVKLQNNSVINNTTLTTSPTATTTSTTTTTTTTSPSSIYTIDN